LNNYHTRNRANWNDHAPAYKLRVDRQDTWHRSHLDPKRVLTPSVMDAFGDLTGKQACVLGSGNNCASLALAGMGAHVTSVDISEKQLQNARTRAEFLGLDIHFVTADVINVGLRSDTYDVIHTGGHVAMWVSDLARYYAEAARILNPGGILVVLEHHPFQTIWSFTNGKMTIDKPYGAEPFLEEGNEDDAYVFNWTVSDYVNSVLGAGLELITFEEHPDDQIDEERANLRGLPEDILLVGRKP
jgi:SAM-dependent methyltransferase